MRPLDARDRHEPVFKRLAQALERRARELAQLVQEQDAAVGEARLAGTRARAAADDRRRRGGVMRRPKRRQLDERLSCRQHACDRVDPRHLERLVARQRREDPGEPAREHRFPGSRRAGEQQVVPSGRSDLERAASPLLAADVTEVRLRRRDAADELRDRLGLAAPAQVRRSLRQVPHGDRLYPGERRLGRRLGRAEEPRQPRAACRLGRDDRPGHRTDAPVERQLPERRVLAQPSGREPAATQPAPPARSAGRSPSLPCARPAGARLTVTRRSGHSSSALAIPLRTRSFASWQARSGSPTIANAGTPRWRWASTSTGLASRPTSA